MSWDDCSDSFPAVIRNDSVHKPVKTSSPHVTVMSTYLVILSAFDDVT